MNPATVPPVWPYTNQCYARNFAKPSLKNSSIVSNAEYTEALHPSLARRPKLTNRFYHLIHVLSAGLESAVQTSGLRAGDRVLDYGCGSMHHRAMFPEGIDYIGTDLTENDKADVALDADGRVPLPSASFDMVFSTQVLEHVEAPNIYLDECRRLLKPGGQLILSTHGTYTFHPCPYDYWRWTHLGLRRSLEQAGFEIQSLEGLCGGLPTALQLLQDVTHNKLPRFLRPVLYAFIQSLMALTDKLYKPAQRLSNPTFLVVTAKAPDSAGTPDSAS